MGEQITARFLNAFKGNSRSEAQMSAGLGGQLATNAAMGG